MKIEKIVKTGFVDTRRVLSEDDYIKTKSQFLEEYDIELPEVDDLPVDLSETRILLDPLRVKVHTDIGVFTYTFDRGFITDFASVPNVFRSAIDNDDKELVLSALCHDANFRYHFLSFGKSNLLFRLMNEKAGASWFVYFFSWAAVNSPFGRKNYENNNAMSDRRVKFFWGDR